MEACHIMINQPSSYGVVGGVFNFIRPAAFSVGCGSHGGNSLSEPVQCKHLLNYKQVCTRRENAMTFAMPKLFVGKGSIEDAIEAMKGRKRCLVIAEKGIKLEYLVTLLRKFAIQLHEVEKDVVPTSELINEVAGIATGIQADVIFAIGG